VAIDFSQTEEKPATKPEAESSEPAKEVALAGPPGTPQPPKDEAASDAPAKHDPLAAYDFDAYGGKLYRVFEGTVLEGVVTNHIDGSMAGPILIMLTTDYYSHDRQQLLLPQGTRLIGEVGSVGNQQQHRLMVVFHRAVCPDGFSIDLEKYPGLDPLGTTGLATKVDHGYLMAFGAAAAVGGLGGLSQIGNSGSSLTTSSQLRNGLSSQTSAEGEQILDHFLNRLPIITLKEGSRARVYINRDILIPSYAEHRVNPTL
jgi:type IV secretion system protein VirB10